MKYLCFRFDVDTHKCIRDGVPNLLTLAKDQHVKFTFFINVGKAIDRWHLLKSSFKKNQKKNIKSLSPITKLGLKDYLIISLLNPFIGMKYANDIKMISKHGHEIGLHGGMNHQTWFNDAKSWSAEKIKKELLWAMNILNHINKKPVIGFTSPGWNGSYKINSVLKQLGFLYVSDIHSSKPIEKIIETKGLTKIPTNIAGEPGGVGYLEHCRALKMTDSQILADFKDKLDRRKKLAVIYDHPYYAGVKELILLKKMIELAKNMSVSIIMMKEILNKL